MDLLNSGQLNVAMASISKKSPSPHTFKDLMDNQQDFYKTLSSFLQEIGKK